MNVADFGCVLSLSDGKVESLYRLATRARLTPANGLAEAVRVLVRCLPESLDRLQKELRECWTPEEPQDFTGQCLRKAEETFLAHAETEEAEVQYLIQVVSVQGKDDEVSYFARMPLAVLAVEARKDGLIGLLRRLNLDVPRRPVTANVWFAAPMPPARAIECSDLPAGIRLLERHERLTDQERRVLEAYARVRDSLGVSVGSGWKRTEYRRVTATDAQGRKYVLYLTGGPEDGTGLYLALAAVSDPEPPPSPQEAFSLAQEKAIEELSARLQAEYECGGQAAVERKLTHSQYEAFYARVWPLLKVELTPDNAKDQVSVNECAFMAAQYEAYRKGEVTKNEVGASIGKFFSNAEPAKNPEKTCEIAPCVPAASGKDFQDAQPQDDLSELRDYLAVQFLERNVGVKPDRFHELTQACWAAATLHGLGWERAARALLWLVDHRWPMEAVNAAKIAKMGEVVR